MRMREGKKKVRELSPDQISSISSSKKNGRGGRATSRKVFPSVSLSLDSRFRGTCWTCGSSSHQGRFYPGAKTLPSCLAEKDLSERRPCFNALFGIFSYAPLFKQDVTRKIISVFFF